MIFNKRFFQLLIRIVLLIALVLALDYTYFQTDLTITPIMFGVLILAVAIEMTWRLQKQERNWARFLLSVKYRDFNRTYQNQTDSKELIAAYDLITQSMEELKSSQEAEFQLLQTVLGHVSMAVVCYQENGEVIFTNRAFDELLELPGLIHIDRLKLDYPKIHQVMFTKEGAPSEWIDHVSGQKLFVKTESFKLKGQGLRLASFTDIRSSLDAKELESYQKLMSVMTHEIMNSTTPIFSLIKVVNKKLVNGSELVALDTKDQQNVSFSLKAIEDRTSGMLKFVEAYKQINRPIQPHMEAVHSKDLIGPVISLMTAESDTNLVVNDEVNDTLILDKTLISQVLINLVKNALDAVQVIENPTVVISLNRVAEGIALAVEDNGQGVASRAIPQIFVPFYTTKPTGSGIGLALSRKIAKAHGGTLEYSRVSDKTRFTMCFPDVFG